jgi:hypothetical protein
MRLGETIVIRLGTGTRTGDIVKINTKTIWVRLPDGKTIKRKIDRDIVK